MNYKNSVNTFFKNKYGALCDFAFLPYSYEYFYTGGSTGDQLAGIFRNFSFKVLFTPILLPMTLCTVAISIFLTMAMAFCHGVSIIAAQVLDSVSNQEPSPTTPAKVN